MKIKGIVTEIMQVRSIETARGTTQMGGLVLNVPSEYPYDLQFDVFGEEKLSKIQGIKNGDEIIVDFLPNSRKYKDKWFTSLRLLGIVTNDNADNVQQAPEKTLQQPTVTEKKKTNINSAEIASGDDLPF